MVEILQLVLREVARADVNEKLTYGMVITGGGSELKNLAGLAEETINMPIRIGKPNNISGAVDIASGPSYSSAIGLSQWKKFGNEINNKNSSEIIFKSAINKMKNLFNDFF